MTYHDKTPTVYIMTNKKHTVLYIGVTASLKSRVWQHKGKSYPNSFTSKYKCSKLVFYEDFPTMEEAITCEKRFKNWKREWKETLITKKNSNWEDLSREWFEDEGLDSGSSPE